MPFQYPQVDRHSQLLGSGGLRRRISSSSCIAELLDHVQVIWGLNLVQGGVFSLFHSQKSYIRLEPRLKPNP